MLFCIKLYSTINNYFLNFLISYTLRSERVAVIERQGCNEKHTEITIHNSWLLS